MRGAVVLLIVLVLAPLSACAGPRLAAVASTAHLPGPVVRRADAPTTRIDTEARPPETPDAKPPAICDT